jgi:hypothetical protein
MFWTIFTPIAAAQIPWEGDFTFKATVKRDAIDVDTTIGFSFSGEAFELSSTWKATEKGYSSLKFVGEAEFPKEIEGRFEVLLGKEGLESIKLKGIDLPLRKALLALESYFKSQETLTLYQVAVDLDELTLAKLPASVDLVFRDEYLRAKLTVDRKDDTFSAQGVWKKGTLYEVKTTLDHEAGDWSIKEVVTFKPSSSLFHPEKGTLTIDGDMLDWLSLNVACEHTFPQGGIAATKLTPTVELEVGAFELTWKATFKPMSTAFRLETYTLTLADKVEINDISLDAVLKIEEDGFSSFSVRLSLSV